MKQFNLKKQKMLFNQSLPHNFLAEKMVLSCLLINSEAIEITITTLPVKGFYFKNHQEIYRAIISIYMKKSSVDIISLTSFLQENGLLKKIGGIKVLLELINQVPNLIYFEEYLQLVKDKFLRRSLIKFGYKIINSSYTTNISVTNIVQSLENELLNFNEKNRTKKNRTMAPLLTDICRKLKEKSLNPTLPGLSSGFLQLDNLTQGFQKSDLIIIAGRPSMGKTALGLNLVLNSIKISRLPILFFSLEMSKEQIMYRILSIETEIDQINLKNGKLYRNDWIKLNKTIKLVSILPLFIHDSTNLTISDIRFHIKNVLLEQMGISLVIVDYLQLIHNPNLKNIGRVQELSQITRSLKNLARDFEIPIIALSQLSRNIENRLNQTPMLSDLRESGSIEQDADLVIMLSREKQQSINSSLNKHKSSKINLIVAKHRNGPTGLVKLLFHQNHMKFQQIN